jgi:hypothetical protein
MKTELSQNCIDTYVPWYLLDYGLNSHVRGFEFLLQTYKLFALQEVIQDPLFCREDWSNRQMAMTLKAVLEYEKKYLTGI